MAKVVSWELIGGRYRGGYFYPGAAVIWLDNGKVLFFSEKNGIVGALDEADKLGHDTTEVRARLEQS